MLKPICLTDTGPYARKRHGDHALAETGPDNESKVKSHVHQQRSENPFRKAWLGKKTRVKHKVCATLAETHYNLTFDF